jgi:hypothetical protein
MPTAPACPAQRLREASAQFLPTAAFAFVLAPTCNVSNLLGKAKE